MSLNLADLVKAAVPEGENRNVRITSQSGTNFRDPNFLSDDFPRSQPKLYVIAESDDFDDLTLSEWRDEGFDAEYLSMGNGGAEFRQTLKDLSMEKRGPCETFGIVAYGDAAAFCLEHYHVLDNNPEFKLGLLIAYYPTAIPDPKGHFPSSIRVLVHLIAGDEIGITKQSQMVGIQGKRRTSRRKIESGLGTGGVLDLAYPSYTYRSPAGFAEHDLEEYDRVCADLAWSRSLGAARKALGKNVDLEGILEQNIQGKFFTRNLKSTLSSYTTHKTPRVTHIPTLTGAIGAPELQKFYSQFFGNPTSLKLTLLSRTIGTDRVVDEVHVRFKHTQEMPWILPGVPATNKSVKILVVSIITLRGGKLYHENVYWDQASVLVQVGLLDPKLIPDAARDLGVERLPVVGGEAASRILKGRDRDNGLMDGWDDSDEANDDDAKGQVGDAKDQVGDAKVKGKGKERGQTEDGQ